MTSTEPKPSGSVPSEPPQTTPPPVEPPSLLRRTLGPAIKFGLAAALLYYVLNTKMNDDAKLELKRIFVDSPSVLAWAIAAYSVQIFIGAYRMRMLLEPQGVQIGYFQSLRLTYLGAFFDTFMITSVGGDAVKAIYLARECPAGKRLEGVSILLLDRLMGLLGLLTLMVGMTVIYLPQLSADPVIQPQLKWLFIVPLMLLIGTGMLLSSRMYGIFSRIMAQAQHYTLLRRLAPLAATVDRVYATLQKFRNRPLVLLQTWGLSILVHLFGVICGYVLVGGMGQGEKAFGPFLVAWFVANFVCSFAPAGGIGLGQALYNPIFLKIADIQNGWVLATAVQATAILAKTPGLFAWLGSRENPNLPGPDAKKDNTVN